MLGNSGAMTARANGSHSLGRMRRTAASLAAVLGALVLYRLAVVPLIDPSAPVPESTTLATESERVNSPTGEANLTDYQRMFPPGAWERDNPIVLEADGATLLMREYENLPDGRVRLFPCTVVFWQGGNANPSARGRAVALQAPQGAILQFDAPIDLRRAKMGQLLGGKLTGPVTIQGSASRPGLNDELLITAPNDVQFNDQQIWTMGRIDFRYGPSAGTGRDLRIFLLPGKASRRRGPNVGDIERLELAREVQMRLQVGEEGLFPGDESRRSAAANAAVQPEQATSPSRPPEQIDIMCTGPFVFDLDAQVARFTEQVQVFRAAANGVSDQLRCDDELRIHFSPREELTPALPAPKPNSPPQDSRIRRLGALEPRRIEALGRPVTVFAPSGQVTARGNRLEYDRRIRRTVLVANPGEPDVEIKQRDNEFRGRSLTYEQPDGAGLPRVLSEGPGWLRAAAPNGPPQVLEARWTRGLSLAPESDKHLLRLAGEASVKSTRFGDLAGEEIQAWLLELPAIPKTPTRPAADPAAIPGGEPSMRGAPERLLATNRVTFHSDRAEGATDRLEVWFDTRRAESLRNAARQNAPSGGSRGGNLAAETHAAGAGRPLVVVDNPRGRQAAPPAGVAALAGLAPSGMENAKPEDDDRPKSKYVVQADSIRMQLVERLTIQQVEHIDLDGAIQMDEVPLDAAKEKPLAMSGEVLRVRGASTPDTTLTLTGRPGEVSARGMLLSGGEIRMDLKANRLWIDGQGRMILPAAGGLAPGGRPTAGASPPRQAGRESDAPPLPVTIDWLGGMNFDGKVLRCERGVTMQMEQREPPRNPASPETRRIHRLTTDVLEAEVRTRVDFSAFRPTGDGPPVAETEIKEIRCPAAVDLASQTFSERKLIARQSLRVRDLKIEQPSGALVASGPGFLQSVRLGQSTPAFLGPARVQGERADPKADEDKLSYLYVEFQRQAIGNVNQRELVFQDQVKGVSGPVSDWNQTLKLQRPEENGPRAVCLSCDELQVNQAIERTANDETIELQARGNTLIEGETFTARADRLTFVEAKDQLVLSGGARSMAELFFQPQAGGPERKAKAEKIVFHPRTRAYEIQEGAYFDVGLGAPSK